MDEPLDLGVCRQRESGRGERVRRGVKGARLDECFCRPPERDAGPERLQRRERIRRDGIVEAEIHRRAVRREAIGCRVDARGPGGVGSSEAEHAVARVAIAAVEGKRRQQEAEVVVDRAHRAEDPVGPEGIDEQRVGDHARRADGRTGHVEVHAGVRPREVVALHQRGSGRKLETVGAAFGHDVAHHRSGAPGRALDDLVAGVAVDRVVLQGQVGRGSSQIEARAGVVVDQVLDDGGVGRVLPDDAGAEVRRDAVVLDQESGA